MQRVHFGPHIKVGFCILRYPLVVKDCLHLMWTDLKFLVCVRVDTDKENLTKKKKTQHYDGTFSAACKEWGLKWRSLVKLATFSKGADTV